MCSWICHEPLLWLLKMLSPAVCLAKYLLQHESIKCILHTRKDFKKQTTHLPECDVLYWEIYVRFLFLSVIRVVSKVASRISDSILKYKCASFCHIYGLYFDVWWLNLLWSRHALWIFVSHLSQQSADRAPDLQWIVRTEGWKRPLQGDQRPILLQRRQWTLRTVWIRRLWRKLEQFWDVGGVWGNVCGLR